MLIFLDSSSSFPKCESYQGARSNLEGQVLATGSWLNWSTQHDAIFELLFGHDTDVAEDGAGELGKKPSTRLTQEPYFGVKANSKRPAG
jgi:hypothetical protein